MNPLNFLQSYSIPLFLSDQEMTCLTCVNRTMAHLWRIRERSISQFVLPRLCADPYQLYQELRKPGSVPISSCLLALRLCLCGKVVGTGRQFLEENSISLLEKSHSKDSLLTLVSVGAGKCYQELIYLAKLIHAGYQQIQVVLIDHNDIPKNSLDQFCKRFLKQCKINIIQYRSLKEYAASCQRQSHLKPNLLLLLDITDKAYNVNNRPLPDYAFTLLKDQQFITENTVIAHSMFSLKVIKEPVFSVVPTASYICAYAGTSAQLSDTCKNGAAMDMVIDQDE